MSIYDEMAAIGLKAYARMLQIDIPPSENGQIDIEQYQIAITEKLNEGARATPEPIEDFTPLMLYATFHINDERFDEEFEKGEEKILHWTSLRGESFSTNNKMNALACAVFSNNQIAVERLLDTGHFSNERDYQVAVELVALSNRPNMVSLFHSAKCSFFIPDFPAGNTPFMYACYLGHTDCVRAILAHNPTDEQLHIRDQMEGRTAYDLARQAGHQEILDLLTTECKIYFVLLLDAIRSSEETNLINTILQNSREAGVNALIHADALGGHSLIAIAYQHENHAFRDTILEYFHSYYESLNPQEKIQTLWLTLFSLYKNSENNAEAIAFYTPQIEALLDDHASQMVEFIFNGLFGLNPTLWNYAKRILKEAKGLRSIKIPYACPDIHDPHDTDFFGGVACINLASDLGIEFVSCILDKSQLVQCELLTDTIHKPLTDIVQYIVTRNKEIAATTSEDQQHSDDEQNYESEQDKIHARYQERINLKLMRFMRDDRVQAEERVVAKNLLRKNCSLKMLAALTFYNDPVIPKGVVKDGSVDDIMADVQKVLRAP